MLSRPIAAAGALALTFTAAGCPIDPIAEGTLSETNYCDDGPCTSHYYTSYTSYEPTTEYNWDEYCLDYDCCDSYGCYEESYYPTTYEPTSTSIDPTTQGPTTIPDTDTVFTDTISTDTGDTDATSASTGTGTGTDTDTGTGTASTGTGTGTDTGTETGTDTGTTASTSDATTDETTASTTDTTTEGEDAFPPLGVFGDDLIDFDLVGTWNLQWAPDGSTADSVLTIDMTGEWTWRETSADCSVDTLASGVLWLDNGHIILHVETWDRQLPWDTLPVLGQDFPPPFRLSMTYALLSADDLVITGPDRLTELVPYTSRAHLQASSTGPFLSGQWFGEVDLTAVVFGEQTAKIIVRDRFIADLGVEINPVPEGDGLITHDQVFYGVDPPLAGPTLFEAAPWTCLGGCPQPAGQTLINGNDLYAYGPYAGFQRLGTIVSGRTFKRNVDTDCP